MNQAYKTYRNLNTRMKFLIKGYHKQIETKTFRKKQIIPITIVALVAANVIQQKDITLLKLSLTSFRSLSSFTRDIKSNKCALFRVRKHIDQIIIKIAATPMIIELNQNQYSLNGTKYQIKTKSKHDWVYQEAFASHVHEWMKIYIMYSMIKKKNTNKMVGKFRMFIFNDLHVHFSRLADNDAVIKVKFTENVVDTNEEFDKITMTSIYLNGAEDDIQLVHGKPHQDFCVKKCRCGGYETD